VIHASGLSHRFQQAILQRVESRGRLSVDSIEMVGRPSSHIALAEPSGFGRELGLLQSSNP
jgi:hypothetical protein